VAESRILRQLKPTEEPRENVWKPRTQLPFVSCRGIEKNRTIRAIEAFEPEPVRNFGRPGPRPGKRRLPSVAPPEHGLAVPRRATGRDHNRFSVGLAEQAAWKMASLAFPAADDFQQRRSDIQMAGLGAIRPAAALGGPLHQQRHRRLLGTERRGMKPETMLLEFLAVIIHHSPKTCWTANNSHAATATNRWRRGLTCHRRRRDKRPATTNATPNPNNRPAITIMYPPVIRTSPPLSRCRRSARSQTKRPRPSRREDCG
jgi:hypothetical protein